MYVGHKSGTKSVKGKFLRQMLTFWKKQTNQRLQTNFFHCKPTNILREKTDRQNDPNAHKQMENCSVMKMKIVNLIEQKSVMLE